MTESKTCTLCGETKKLTDFYKHKKTKDGLTHRCKECCKMLSKNWRKNNPNYLKEYYRKQPEYYHDWAKNNRDSRNEVNQDQRVKKAGVPTEYLPKGWYARVLNFYGRKCLIEDCTNKPIIDHVKPTSEGGVHAVRNMQPLCHQHNSMKRKQDTDYRTGRILIAFVPPMEEGFDWKEAGRQVTRLDR